MAAPQLSPAAPAEPSPPRRKQDLAPLRALIRVLERGAPPAAAAAGVVPLGLAALDWALPGGGLARGALHEVVPANPAGADAGASSGFLGALLVRLLAAGGRAPVLWCFGAATRRDTGTPYGPGLAGLGLDPGRLLFVGARSDAEVLWAMREGLDCPALAAVVGETEAAPDLAATRRLQLAAAASGVTALLLGRRAFGSVPSAALTRWCVGAAPSRAAEPAEGLGRPRWRVGLVRCRGGPPHDWLLEWCDETGDLALAAVLPDRSAEPAVARAAG
jgi:protein ImuA